ncbi:MAG: hypothetical protein EAZ62_03745 [Sphingobacteriia bacterium]|nr:MAG: hypothetical protein EAZ62_03745 [Sphingobacteriia bacterium]
MDNYAPLMKIQEKVFKNRNFAKVQLADLNNELRFNKGQIEVPRMQIQTNIMHLFVEGVYGLSGPTDLRIQVPLKNLRKSEGMDLPKASDNTAKGGASIYLRAKSNGNEPVGIALDAFGAVRKTKVEAKIK